MKKKSSRNDSTTIQHNDSGISSITTNQDLNALVNTKISNFNMTTQAYHEKIKPKIKKGQLIKLHVNTLITKTVAHKNQRTNVNIVLTYQSIQTSIHLEVNKKEDQIQALII